MKRIPGPRRKDVPHIHRTTHIIRPRARLAWLIAATTLAMVAPAGPLAAAHARSSRAGWYPSVGGAWFHPTDATVRRVYEGGPGVAGGIGYAWNRRFGIEMRLGWLRCDGVPEARLAESAVSRLQLMPFTAELLWRAPLAGSPDGAGSWNAFVGAGPAIVFSREEFAYRLAGSTINTEGRRSDPAGTLSLGLEGSMGAASLGWRLAARGVLASGQRKVLRPGGRSDERGSIARPSQVNLGFELTWR